MTKETIMLRYSDNSSFDEVFQTFSNLRNTFPDHYILCIPYSIDILFNCSLDQLYDIRDMIEGVIWKKEREQK